MRGEINVIFHTAKQQTKKAISAPSAAESCKTPAIVGC